MPHVQTGSSSPSVHRARSSLLYSRNIAPTSISDTWWGYARPIPGIGFLFVPLSVLTYQTVPRQLQGDATALFTMFRNVAARWHLSVDGHDHVANQVHMAYLSYHMTTPIRIFAAPLAICASDPEPRSTAAASTQSALDRPIKR